MAHKMSVLELQATYSKVSAPIHEFLVGMGYNFEHRESTGNHKIPSFRDFYRLDGLRSVSISISEILGIEVKIMKSEKEHFFISEFMDFKKMKPLSLYNGRTPWEVFAASKAQDLIAILKNDLLNVMKGDEWILVPSQVIPGRD